MYQINFKLKKTLITLSSEIISSIVSSFIPLSIPVIIKFIRLVSNISINDLLLAISNGQILASQGYRRELANLEKIYTNEVKYIGKNNSFLFIKLMIFHHIYVRTDVSHVILLKAFLTMLTSLVLDYYYLNTNISNTGTFDEICDLIQTYFEGGEHK